MRDEGMGMRNQDWGLGIRDWGLGIRSGSRFRPCCTVNPLSPQPNSMLSASEINN